MSSRLTLEQACEVVARGGLVLYPTETLWGIGGDARRMDVVQRILACKGIAQHRPFPVLADSVLGVQQICPPNLAGMDDLVRQFWPGGLTLAVPVNDPDLERCVGLNGQVGLRLSALDVPTELARACGGFLVSTSANATGAPPPLSLAQIAPPILQAADGVVGAGVLAGGDPSTLLVYQRGSWSVGRVGAIPLDALRGLVDLQE
jgi:L-threonylcarbamoyladenylate synthase